MDAEHPKVPPGRGASHAGTPRELVYAVRSMRTGTISVGIDLTAGGACPIACDYCQVPAPRDTGPKAMSAEEQAKALATLERELIDALGQWGDAVGDVAFAGSGEPTWSPMFVQALACAVRTVEAHGPVISGARPPVRVFTCAATLGQGAIRTALAALVKGHHGEVWVKLDSWDEATYQQATGTPGQEAHEERVLSLAREVPVVIQTMLVKRPGGPSAQDVAVGMRHALVRLRTAGAKILRVELSTLHRAPGDLAARVQAVTGEDLDHVAKTLRTEGFHVRGAPTR